MALVGLGWLGKAAVLTLDRPERHNALVPELLEDLRAAIAASVADGATALVLTGAGRSFSTGGDVGAFLDAAGTPEGLDAYGEQIVGALNAVILNLLSLSVPVIAKVNGPVTGGSVGLVLAADLVAIAETAFIQPYYSEVGFSPDGGWTALLPERIGAAKALEIQFLNRRIDAPEAAALGLATTVAPADALDGVVAGWLDALAMKSATSLAATRQLVWSEERKAGVAARLDAELASFRDLIARAETRRGMEAFVNRRRRTAAGK